MTRATARRRRTASALMALALAGGASTAALTLAAPAHADSWRDKEYWLAESGITKAWDVSKGAGVKVAVIDSGVDGQHPDLGGVLAGGADISGAGKRQRPGEYRRQTRTRHPRGHHARRTGAPGARSDCQTERQRNWPCRWPGRWT